MNKKNSILDAPLDYPKGDYGVDYGVLTDKISDRIKIIKGLDVSSQLELVFYFDEILEKLKYHTLRNLFYAWMYGRKSPSDSNIFRPGKGDQPSLYFIATDVFKDDSLFNYGLEKLGDETKVNLAKHPILEKNRLPSEALSINLLKLIKKCSAKSPIVRFTIPNNLELIEFDVIKNRTSPGNGYPLTSLRVASYGVRSEDIALKDLALSSTLPESLTGLGSFNLNLFASGEIDISDKNNVVITYNKFAYFFQDYFNFKGEQTLGVWTFEGLDKWRTITQKSMKEIFDKWIDHPDEITNQVMRDFKEKVIPKYNDALDSGKWLIPEGKEEAKLLGRDFKILSPVVPYAYPPFTKTIPMADLTEYLKCLP